MKYVFAMAVIFSCVNVHAAEVVPVPTDEVVTESPADQQIAVTDVDAALKEIQSDIEKSYYPELNADAE